MLCKYALLSGLLMRSVLIPGIFLTVFGCAAGLRETATNRVAPSDKNIVREGKQEIQKKYEGSLWQGDGPLSELFQNPKARKVGDIVTVSIVESSSASNNAATQTNRKSFLSAQVNGFLGMEKRYPTAAHPFFDPFSSIKGGLESDFEGSGTTSRSGRLAATITTMVVEVLHNGNMHIVGSREVAVNNERQVITLSGIIRQRDISPDNIILSTYICDASISYSGAGIVNERQRPGWASRIFDVVWPF